MCVSKLYVPPELCVPVSCVCVYKLCVSRLCAKLPRVHKVCECMAVVLCVEPSVPPVSCV